MTVSQCGAKTKAGKPCTQPSGWGTSHPGTGRCKLHGGNAGRPVTHGRYSAVQRPRIKALLAEFEKDEDPLNLVPELHLLRSLILDFVERYDEQTEALIAWHASFNPLFNEHFALWEARISNWRAAWLKFGEEFTAYRAEVEQVQVFYRQGWPEPPELNIPSAPPTPPEPSRFEGKPRQVLDILSAGKFIANIATLTERIEKSRAEGTITLETLRQTLQQFGVEMAQAVMETPIGTGNAENDESVRSAILENVEKRWAALTLPGPAIRKP